MKAVNDRQSTKTRMRESRDAEVQVAIAGVQTGWEAVASAWILLVALSIPYRSLPFLTVPYSPVPFRTDQYRSVPYHPVPYRTVPILTDPHRSVPVRTLPFRTFRYRFIPYNFPNRTVYRSVPFRTARLPGKSFHLGRRSSPTDRTDHGAAAQHREGDHIRRGSS